MRGATLARGYVYPTQTWPPPLLAISRPPDFLSFHRLSLLLRPFSLSISRKIITSGRWGGASGHPEASPSMLGGGGNGAGGRGAEGRGHGNLEVSRVGGHRRARRDAPPHRWLDTTPSRRAIGTTYDRAQIRTNPTPGSSERISGSRDPRRGPQGGVAPPAIGHCRRRSGGGLQNAIITFQPPWYKLETP